MRRIAIQGEIGSFHDVASHCYFEGEDIELICCDTFEQVFDEMKKDSNVVGVVAIENTIAGSLLHNYDLLRESGAQIVGEHKLRISHSIMCLPDEDWKDITEVNSHPQFLDKTSHSILLFKLRLIYGSPPIKKYPVTEVNGENT